MKKIQDIQINKNSISNQQTGSKNYSSETGQVINDLFSQIIAIKPAWKNAFQDREQMNEAKRQWIIGFQESKINDSILINHGLAECRKDTSDFMPSVGKFISWCNGGDLPEQLGPAYREFEPSKLIEKGTKQGRDEAAKDNLEKMRGVLK